MNNYEYFRAWLYVSNKNTVNNLCKLHSLTVIWTVFLQFGKHIQQDKWCSKCKYTSFAVIDLQCYWWTAAVNC